MRDSRGKFTRSLYLEDGLCVCMDRNCQIPYGYCHCGCNLKTSIATYSSSLEHVFKGSPKRFIAGHKRVYRTDMSDAVPFKIDGKYCKLIQLTNGQYAIVDNDKYHMLSKYSWNATEYQGAYYASTTIKYKDGKKINVKMHRMVLGLENGNKVEADHINLVTLDNRTSNLRKANKSEQKMNSGVYKNSKTGVKGVFLKGKKYYARISVYKKIIHIGVFDSLEEAADARREAAKKYHGEFARFE